MANCSLPKPEHLPGEVRAQAWSSKTWIPAQGFDAHVGPQVYDAHVPAVWGLGLEAGLPAATFRAQPVCRHPGAPGGRSQGAPTGSAISNSGCIVLNCQHPEKTYTKTDVAVWGLGLKAGLPAASFRAQPVCRHFGAPGGRSQGVHIVDTGQVMITMSTTLHLHACSDTCNLAAGIGNWAACCPTLRSACLLVSLYSLRALTRGALKTHRLQSTLADILVSLEGAHKVHTWGS